MTVTTGATPAGILSTSYGAGGIVGSTEPRLWTPPLRELTPATSYGFEACEFARDIVRHPLDPWQEWLVIHAGELLPDGRPRFRIVIVLVARQNGKTDVLVVLSLYWLFVDRVEMMLGTSTKLDYAAESWRKAIKLAKRVPRLRQEITHRAAIRKANGEQVLWRGTPEEIDLDEGSRYKIAASNEEGGRSLTLDRLVLDELRQHHDYSAWDASVPAATAVPDAQVFALSNAGSDRSVVLNTEREAALRFLETGVGDPRVGLFEWSAPEGSSPLDIPALAQANPNLGRRIDPDALLGQAQTAVEKGGEKLAGFKTEHMCMWVRVMDPAVDPTNWGECRDLGDMEAVRSRLAACVDVSLDGQHAALLVAAVIPVDAPAAEPVDQDAEREPVDELAFERVRIEAVKAWSGPHCLSELQRDLPALVRKIRPKVLGWFPAGPAAAVAAKLAARKQQTGGRAWPPPGVRIEEIRLELPAVCMGFAQQVDAGAIAHSDDPMINAHVLGAEKAYRGDGIWVMTRKDSAGPINGAYAAAGAVHLARTLPPVPKLKVITGRKGRRAD